MTFDSPQALLLFVPIAIALWRSGLPRGRRSWLRLVAIVLAVLALAGPRAKVGGGGRDVIVVVDRSRSMPPASDQRAMELIRDLEHRRGPGDRLGVVAFGSSPRVEAAPTRDAFNGFQHDLDVDGSDLGAALDAAGDLVSPNREARVLVLSDGLDTDDGARGAARRLAAKGVPVDWRLVARDASAGDVAVASLDLPADVREGEPFLFSATIRATDERRVRYRLLRGSSVLAEGVVDAHAGLTRLPFRDRLDHAGLAEYALELTGTNDAQPENDRGLGVVRVSGRPRVLVVRADGRTSALAKALIDSKLDVEVTSSAPHSLSSLENVGAVVLENVPASALGEQGLEVLASYVRDAGGGLLMTGGRHSFGEGGYFRSALDPVLPVSMELRKDDRRASIALGITMDRSGSMSVKTPDGETKMHLAGAGAVAALELLQKGDEAAVWVVDTKPHVIFPLTKVEDGLSLDLVSNVVSEGGGIFIGEALDAAADEMLQSHRATRHIVLFADAADSEEPGDYRQVLAKLRDAKITVSVIGLGTEHDSDAALLEEIAQLGGGRVYFADDANDLPRLFSEDTIVVARSSFIDKPAALASTPDLALIGVATSEALPNLGGFNRTYTRPQASVALRTADDDASPVLAFWPSGAGHAAAFTGEVDGAYTGALRDWSGYRALFSRVVRHLANADDATDAFVKARLEGRTLHVSVELADDAPTPSGELSATLLTDDASAKPRTLPLAWEDAHHLGVRFPIDHAGVMFPVVQLGSRVLRAPPVALPYSPEFAPRPPGEGRRLLTECGAVSGGVERLSMADVFTAGAGRRGTRALAPWLVAVALALLVAEVLVRRLSRAPRARERSRAAAPKTRPADAPSTIVSAPADAPGPTPAPAAAPPDSVLSALERARDRARRRL